MGGWGMKRIFWVAFVGVFLLSGGLAGCASPTSTYGSGPFSATDVDKIVKGKTTKGEILRTFGQPASMTRNPQDGSEMLSYNYIKSNATVKPQSYIPVVGMFVGGVDGTATAQALTVTVSKNGTVDDYNYSEHLVTSKYPMLGGDMSTRTIQTR